jgi:hypothetical protein
VKYRQVFGCLYLIFGCRIFGRPLFGRIFGRQDCRSFTSSYIFGVLFSSVILVNRQQGTSYYMVLYICCTLICKYSMIHIPRIVIKESAGQVSYSSLVQLEINMWLYSTPRKQQYLPLSQTADKCHNPIPGSSFVIRLPGL